MGNQTTQKEMTAEITDSQIDQFIGNLPKPVKDVIEEGAWEDRVTEIGQKYSLDQDQIDKLADKVLLTLVGLDAPDTFIADVISDLRISRILAEEVASEVESRIFEPALNKLEKLEKNTDNRPEFSTATEVNPPTSNIPEIKPSNLPMIEKDQVSVPKYIEPPKSIVDNKLNSIVSAVKEDLGTPTKTSPGEVRPTDSPDQSRKKYVADPYREPLN